MVMHSYGGMIGTDAVTDDLLCNRRAAAEKSGRVIHLLYMCAYILEPGTSVIDISKAAGFFHLWPQFIHNYNDGSTFPVDPTTRFLNGAEPADVEAALPHLVRSPLSAFNALSEGDCWKKLPVTYIHTFQDGSIERAEKSSVIIKKENSDACHSIFITNLSEMVDLTLSAAKDGRNVR